MRQLITLAIILGLAACAGAQTEEELLGKYCYIELPNRQKIMLRYSTIDEVIAALGEPDEKEYFEVGHEDFWWQDFWSYSYKQDHLVFRFHAPSRAIIFISADVQQLEGYRFPFSLESGVGRRALLRELKRSEGITEPEIIQGSIAYYMGPTRDYLLSGWIIFLNGEQQYTVYYMGPWDER
jgi:hypothetical protein